MAKTVAEVSAYTELLAERYSALRTDCNNLWAKYESAMTAVSTYRDDSTRHAVELAETRKILAEERALGRQRDAETAALRQEIALLRQQFDDQAKRHDTWANRAWGFFVVLVGALLSLASGLVVTLARK